MAYVRGRRQYDTRSGRIIPNVLPRIILIDRNIQDAGYVTFMSKLNGVASLQEKVTWDTDEFRAIKDTIDGAVTGTTQTTLKFDNPSYFNLGELWGNKRTGEIVQIVSVNTSTQIVEVIRAVTALNSSGGSAAAAVEDGDTFNRISTAVGENSSRQQTITTTPTEVYNYCQIFRMDLSMSERQVKRELENDNEYSYQEMKMLKEFRMDLDRAFLFGEKARFDNNDGDDTTLMGGIRPAISTNTFSVGGTLYKSEFDEWCVEEGFRFGSRDKMMFCSTDVLLAFTQMVDSNLSYEIDLVGKEGVTFGTSVLRYIAPNGGRLLLVEDRNISEQYNGEGYLVDMQQMSRRVFSNNGISGEMHVIRETQDPDDPGIVDTIMSDMTQTWGSEKCHGKLTNVSGGSYASPAG